jgi:hypothetical protein
MDATIKKLENCVQDIKLWMTENFLCLNDNKSDLILFGKKSQLDKLPGMQVTVRAEVINSVPCVHNLGAYFDSQLIMSGQVNHITKSAWFPLRKIGQIRKFLGEKSAARLIHAFVSARIDQYNVLLHGIPDYQIQRLQRIQNAAARMLTLISPAKELHVSPILFKLHWLPVRFRIEYGILLLVFKALNGLAPDYIEELLFKKFNEKKEMRSNDLMELNPPKIKTLKTYGDRAFTIAAPHLWNNIPLNVKNSGSVTIFKSRLKTCLFKRAFSKLMH